MTAHRHMTLPYYHMIKIRHSSSGCVSECHTREVQAQLITNLCCNPLCQVRMPSDVSGRLKGIAFIVLDSVEAQVRAMVDPA